MFRRIGIVFLMALLMAACAPRGVDEACCVVAEADSLWQAGQTYDDSLRLAQAYETLSPFSNPLLSTLHPKHSTDYAHACYHYGRLLRRADDPVAAMQVFISGTHSGTDDHHILGRIYSNIGDLCHFASEFQLSYDMFERSAHYFLENGDTLLYYYGLNNMAYELASAGLKDSCLSLLYTIEKSNPNDSGLKTYCRLSRAEVYLRNSQYDSTIYYARECLKCQPNFPAAILQLAQAYSFLGIKDSAVFYAQNTLSLSNELFDKNSAMYILTHNDDSKNREDVRKISADRSDIHKLIEIQQGNLSQAVQLLDQDLHRKPDWLWLYSILVTLAIGGASIYTYIYHKRRQHALLSQKVEDLTIQNKEAETQHEKIIHDLEKHKRTIADEIEKNCKLIVNAESFPNNIHWHKYNKMCSIVDKQFYLLASKLHTKYKLNETETRLCILTLLDCKYDLIADLLYRSNSSIGTLKIRAAKKLGTTAKDLRMYLIENECVN